MPGRRKIADQYMLNARLRKLIFAWGGVRKAGLWSVGIHMTIEVVFLRCEKSLLMQRQKDARSGCSYNN